MRGFAFGAPLPVLILRCPASKYASVAGVDANPQGYANASVTYRAEDFDTEDASDFVADASDNLTTWTWSATGGWDNSPYWKVELGLPTVPLGGENQQGKGTKWWPAAGLVADECDKFFVSFMAKFSTQYLNVAFNNAPQLNKSKIIDIHGFNAGGTTSDSATRQLLQMNVVNPAEANSFGPSGYTHPAGVYLALTNGGAGGRWSADGTNTPTDLRNYADTWLWIGVMFDCSAGGQRSILYTKAQSEALRTSVIRTATSECSSAGTYEFNGRGWSSPPTYNSFLMAYWQENRVVWDPLPNVQIGRIRSGNGWITPPF